MPLGSPGLTDRQRLSILLQASALLAHLRLWGGQLAAGWDRARVDEEGALRCLPVVRDGRPEMPQESLLDLTAILFGPPRGEVAGRGEARRLARRLVRLCDQRLLPLGPDEAVERLLEAPGFLWSRPFRAARAALAAEHPSEQGSVLWVAGPGWFRRRLLAEAESLESLEQRLVAEDLRSAWRSPVSARETASVESARRLLADGRFESANRLLESLPGRGPAMLRIASSCCLGRLEAARRGLRQLDPGALSEVEAVEAAETAVAVHTKLGRPAAARPWVERALETGGERERRRAWLSAASLARDRGELGEMERCLERARPQPGGRASWRWRQAAGLGALARRRPLDACRQFGRAMRESRRHLGRFEAAALWNDLAVARTETGDLKGAERALIHAARLHERSDGPRRTTLALFNLAELRLRRGRLRGVREILERSTRFNLETGNRYGLAYDRELRVRYELARGRPESAVTSARAAIEELDRSGPGSRRAALLTLGARALGWLERPCEAARWISRARSGGAGVRALFEPEELPAFWALTGDAERARVAIGCWPGARLWEAVLAGVDPEPSAWKELDDLDAYRAARLVGDLELAAPGRAPRTRLRDAARVLRRLGNVFLAERLERALEGAWRALVDYLREQRPDAAGLERLFVGAGRPDVSLIWRRAGDRLPIVEGTGGPEKLRVEIGGGSLVLTAESIDAELEALFALAARDWRPPRGASAGAPDGVIGDCLALRAAFERAERLATRDVPILIEGETGTGKELLARHVHRTSGRRDGPLVTLNSAAVSESLVLSDLFGHARGAFTGAERDRAGIFESARGGTVFLDELGDLPLQAQGMLLRVVQEGEVRRLGETRTRRVDTRVVAATHRPLERLVSDGRFRQDLYFRLAVGRVALPPLRERGADIDLLTRHFLHRFSPDRNLTLAPDARERLRRHDWPGNVRELGNRLAVAVALCEGNVVQVEQLGLPEPEPPERGGYHQRVLDFRRRLVREALEACDGNRAAAARRLGVSRQALSYLVRALRLG